MKKIYIKRAEEIKQQIILPHHFKIFSHVTNLKNRGQIATSNSFPRLVQIPVRSIWKNHLKVLQKKKIPNTKLKQKLHQHLQSDKRNLKWRL